MLWPAEAWNWMKTRWTWQNLDRLLATSYFYLLQLGFQYLPTSLNMLLSSLLYLIELFPRMTAESWVKIVQSCCRFQHCCFLFLMPGFLWCPPHQHHQQWMWNWSPGQWTQNMCRCSSGFSTSSDWRQMRFGQWQYQLNLTLSDNFLSIQEFRCGSW